MGGIAPRNDNHAVAVVEELSEHLRAVLRDALCGHLEADLCALADDLLAEAEAGGRGRVPIAAAGSGAGAAGWVRRGPRVLPGVKSRFERRTPRSEPDLTRCAVSVAAVQD